MFTDFRAPTVAVVAILSSLTIASVSAQELSGPGQSSIQLQQKVATTFIVTFDESVDRSQYRRNAASLATRFSGRVVHVYETVYPGFAMRVNEAGGASLLAAAGQFGIASVSRDAIVSISANAGNPGANAKPCFVTNTCDTGGGGEGETIGWNIERITAGDTTSYDGSAITACVIDTGIMSLHEDLNVDVDGGTSIIGGSSEDDNGHGTHVAGTIGAIGGNDKGVLGVAPGVTVIPIKVLDANGSGTLSDVVAGIDYAAKKNCTVANLSLGASTTNTTMDEAVTCASGEQPASGYDGIDCSTNTVMFSIAAGNSAVDIIDGDYTPARASVSGSDNIFTIASIAEGDEWSSFSNFHAVENPRVDFALPGQSIRSTWNDGGYNTISGTSMAAPHMAGLLVRYVHACLALSSCPDTKDNGEFVSSDTLKVTRTTSERVKDGPGRPTTQTVDHESYYIVDLPFPGGGTGS